MTTIYASSLHRPLSLSRCLLSHRFYTNSHKPWRAPPRTLLTTLWLQPSRPSTTKNSVQAVSEGGVRGEKLSPNFSTSWDPPGCLSLQGVFARAYGVECCPWIFLCSCLAILSTRCSWWLNHGWCALRLFASLPWFWEVGFAVVVIWRRSVAGVPALGGQHPKKGGNGTFCKSGAYLFCTAYSHLWSFAHQLPLCRKG